jgi:SAM-dependent methyltransferase
MSDNRRNAIKSALVATGLAGPAFRLREWVKSRNAKAEPSPDGLPIPPPYLIQMVVGYTDPQWFCASGEGAAFEFEKLFNEAGADFRNAKRVLDFGCGAGRIIRHMPRITDAELFGVDYNARQVRWCSQNLKGTFKRNRLHPPLDFEAGFFDALYALSVFTHLRSETQDKWLGELHRVLAPGGHALITFHDEFQPKRPDVAEKLKDVAFIVENDTLEGSNLMATFQTWDDARARFSRLFDIVAERRSVDTHFRQAAVVLRKRQLETETGRGPQ